MQANLVFTCCLTSFSPLCAIDISAKQITQKACSSLLDDLTIVQHLAHRELPRTA